MTKKKKEQMGYERERFCLRKVVGSFEHGLFCFVLEVLEPEEKIYLCETQACNVWTSKTFKAASIGKVAERGW